MHRIEPYKDLAHIKRQAFKYKTWNLLMPTFGILNSSEIYKKINKTISKSVASAVFQIYSSCLAAKSIFPERQVLEDISVEKAMFYSLLKRDNLQRRRIFSLVAM